MGTIFTLTEDIRGIAQNAIDDLINELGKTCRLYYPPRAVPCENCILDPIGHKSSGRYRHGGPQMFAPGSLCPMCSGNGTRSEESTEEVKLLCAWSPKNFFIPAPRNIVVPNGRIQTKGFTSDLPKILQAVSMVVEVSFEPLLRARFTRINEPIDQSNIIQGRYFVCEWDRAG